MLKVSEIFYSLQGESTFAGLPCVFVRLAGCNLDCAYCDTAYARRFEAGQAMSLGEILDEVSAYDCGLVEVTGGEPLLQPEAPELFAALLDRGQTVLVETNGSQPIAGLDPRLQLIVDVKTPGSGMADSFLVANLAALLPHHQIKFVLADEDDFSWCRDFIGNFLAGHREIILSPVSASLPASRLAELILENRLPVRLQLQLHKLLWPAADRGR